MTDIAPPGVIVAGMHRSSTSFVASALADCGYQLGDDLLPAGDDNPKGYFEDREVHQLHRALLEAYDTAWDLSPRLRELRRRELAMPAPLQAEAERVAARYRERVPWVWKNPRATLFLEAWARMFPEAIFVICLRPAADVADSMLRRGDRMRISTNRSFYWVRRWFRALSIWRSYNQMALRFARSHRDRVIVVRIPRDLPVLTRCAGGVFEPRLLRRARWWARIPSWFAVRTRWLHYRLGRYADPLRLEALMRRGVRVAPPADAGHLALAPLLRVAVSAAVSVAMDMGYNLTF